MPNLIRPALVACALILLCPPQQAFSQATPAQSPPGESTLYATIAALDAKLFDAYNTCDLTTLATLVTDDLEFYHDKTGLAVGKPVFIEAIRNNICGKVHRNLTPGTLEVHPLAHYGAVEIGRHTFTHPGQPVDGVGEAKFIIVWQFKDGAWKVSRVISYDHAPAKQ